jgi:hypothetical protein
VVLLLATLGTVGCAAAAVGIWVAYAEVARRVQRLTDRLDTGLERAAATSQKVQLAVAKARADVADVRKDSDDLGAGGEKSRQAARATRALVQQRLKPDVDSLGGRLATLADTAVAASSLLESVQELPLGQAPRIDPGQLQRRADQAQELSTVLGRLEATVGDGDKESGGREIAAATGQVDRVLGQCEDALADWQAKIEGTRTGLAGGKAKMGGWLLGAAIVGTFLFLWAGAGQVCLFARSLRWCRIKEVPASAPVTWNPGQRLR